MPSPRRPVPRARRRLRAVDRPQDRGVEAPILAVGRSGRRAERLWLCSPSVGTLQGAPRAVDRGEARPLDRAASISGPLERYAANLADAGIDVVNLHHAEWTAGLVELFHRFGVRAFAWDVQEVRHLRAMLTMGVDAIYSDHVDRMVATVAEFSE